VIHAAIPEDAVRATPPIPVTALIAALATALLAAAPARAETHEVRMLNRNGTGGMVFEPDFPRLRPGDTVQFRATQATHNAASMPELLPAGAAPFKGNINQEIAVRFDRPGTYGVQCIPHYAMGMVMLVQVGDDPVAPIPDALPGAVRRRLGEILARAGEVR